MPQSRKICSTKFALKVYMIFLIASHSMPTVNCYSQWLTWEKTYLYSNYTSGHCVKQTSDGNYIVCGARNYVGLVTKLNQYGDTLWAKYFPVYEMYSIIEGNDGNYVAIGNANDLYVVKISPSGNIIWTKLISEPGYGLFPYHINNTIDNNFIICGEAETSNPTTLCAYYIKLSNNGDKIWAKILSSQSGNRLFYHAKQLPDNDFIFAGTINVNNNLQIYVVRTDSNGDTIWTRSFGSIINEIGHSVIRTNDNGFIVLGSIWYSNLEIRLYLLKTDISGNLVWSKIYGDTSKVYNLEYGNNFAKLNYNNTYVITGFNVNFPTTEFDTNKVFLLNIDSSGNRMWEKFYKKDTMDVAGVSVDVCNDSGFVISGKAKKLHTAGDHRFLYVLKTNKFGEVNPIGVKPNTYEIPKNFKVYQNFPNPFNPNTIIRYEIPKAANVTLTIYDITCREILQISEFKQTGTYSYAFDGTNLASGMYFYKLEAEKYAETRKMVLMK